MFAVLINGNRADRWVVRLVQGEANTDGDRGRARGKEGESDIPDDENEIGERCGCYCARNSIALETRKTETEETDEKRVLDMQTWSQLDGGDNPVHQPLFWRWRKYGALNKGTGHSPGTTLRYAS